MLRHALSCFFIIIVYGHLFVTFVISLSLLNSLFSHLRCFKNVYWRFKERFFEKEKNKKFPKKVEKFISVVVVFFHMLKFQV
jgi:hypothetical protein